MRRLSLEEIEGRDWCFPAFGVPKKNGKIRFVISFQSVNNQLERREYPLTPAKEIFHSIGGFTWATSLDLNIGYLHIRLSQTSQELLTIVMPFGFYSCTVLPMGVMPATDIFQSRIVYIFADMGPELPIPYTKENKKRLGHICKVDNLILIVKKPYELAKAGKISSPTYSEGPYRILKLYENGTVKIQRGSFTDILSIRRIMPYYTRN